MTSFHGSQQEVEDLVRAVRHNCSCREIKRRCPVCDALLNDQRWLDRLLFLRHIRTQLVRGEHHLQGDT